MNKSVILCFSFGLSLTGCASFDQDMVDWRGNVHQCDQAGFGRLGARLAVSTNDTCVSTMEQLGYKKADRLGVSGMLLGAGRTGIEIASPKIQAVVQNSPAERAGLKAGDLLLKVNGAAVRDVLQARKELFGDVGISMSIEVQRGYLSSVYEFRLEQPPYLASAETVANVKKTDSKNN